MLTESLDEKIKLHEDFWSGRGPSLILMPPARMELYDTTDYRRRFHDPQLMWDAEMQRARTVLDWPTDGIPTIRPNLGTIFIPALAGQSYEILDDQMPWPGEPLSMERLSDLSAVDFAQTEVFQLAAEFYRLCRDQNTESIAAYHADTQGIFDIAHLLRGDEIFYDIADPEKKDEIHRLFDQVLALYISVTQALKGFLDEPNTSMIHGHGACQGVLFPHAGARMAEDTATLLSPAMIEEFIMPYVHRAAEAFGGAFVHFCGRHEPLFESLANCDLVRAIDLGNPEMYDAAWLLDHCAATETVLFGRLPCAERDDWQNYTSYLGNLVRQSGARCILKPEVFPESHEECRHMQDMWHELTG